MRGEREIRLKWPAIYAILMSMSPSELATRVSLVAYCVSSHVFVTPVTNDVTNMRLQSHKCVSGRISVTPVT